MNPPVEVPTHALGGGIRQMMSNPLAFFGGLGGTVLVCGLMVFGVLLMSKKANADERAAADAEIDFVPGALVKLGSMALEEDIPEKVITNETRAEENAVEEAVTEEETPPEEEKENKETKEESEIPTPKKDPKLPTSKLPTEKNNPYDDKPTDAKKTDPNAKPLPGLPEGYNPFGSPDGWSDMMQDTDPWAMAVSKLLQNLEPPGYMAKGQAGTFKFQFGIDKEGRVCNTKRQGGTLPVGEQMKIETELERIKFPRPPPELQKKMGSCTNLRYTFTWSTKGVK